MNDLGDLTLQTFISNYETRTKFIYHDSDIERVVKVTSKMGSTVLVTVKEYRAFIQSRICYLERVIYGYDV